MNIDATRSAAQKPAASVFLCPLPRRFDPIFEEVRGEIPIEYLRALAVAESSMRAGHRSGGGAGLMQISPRQRVAYNECRGTAYRSDDLLDPRINAAIAVWRIDEIIRSYRRAADDVPSLRPDWDSNAFVELVTLGWSAGHSERTGIVRVARYLVQQGFDDITIRAIREHSRAGGGTQRLLRYDTMESCRQTVELYRRERVLGAVTPAPSPGCVSHVDARPPTALDADLGDRPEPLGALVSG